MNDYTLTIKSDDLEEDTTLRFIAVYYYQPANHTKRKEF